MQNKNYDSAYNFKQYDINYSDIEAEKVELRQQLTMIRSFVYNFDMDLQGYEWDGTQGKGNYVYTGDCLTDSEARNKILSYLKPFISDINLITELDAKTFSVMKFRTCSLVNEKLTADRLGVPIDNKRLIMNKFMNTMKLIGGVILSSKKDMIKLLAPHTDETISPMRMN